MSPAAATFDSLRAARAELERRIRAGEPARADDLREEYSAVWGDAESALELAYVEYVTRTEVGPAPDRAEWYRRYPQWRDRLERLFGLHDLLAPHPTVPGQGVETWPPDHAPAASDLADIDPDGYTLLAELGRGGMGVVYRARQHALNRIVAVKILREEFAAPTDDGRRLLREAELVGRLQHPNIVQVYHVGTRDGSPFLAMEYVDGAGLDQALVQLQQQRSGGVPARRAAAVVEVLARAIHYAHEQGVIHLDLKPANVLIPGPDGAALSALADDSWSPAGVKIVDFGLAVRPDVAGSSAPSVTLAGTPCYMAPEQADAKRAKLGPATDVYALGGILYELLTHRPPFQGGTVWETLDLVRNKEPVAPRQLRPQLPKDLETICLKCLHKDVARRYPSAAALAEDLHRFGAGLPIAARPVSAVARFGMWARRNPIVAGLAVALIGAIAATIGSLVAKNLSAKSARHTELRLDHELQETLAQELVASARALWHGGQLVAARDGLAQCPPQFRGTQWQALHQLCHAEVGRFTGPEFTASRLSVSPDGTSLALRQHSTPRELYIIDAQTGKPRVTIATGVFPALMEFSADGASMLVLRQVSQRGPTNKLSPKTAREGNWEAAQWDLATNAVVRRWPVSESGATLSRWGRFVAAVDGDVVRVWDGATGEVIAELAERFDRPWRPQVALADDGRHLAITAPSEVRIWDVAARQMTRAIAVGPGSVGSLRFRADGRVLFGNAGQPGASAAEAASRRAIFAWNVADGRAEFQFPAHVLPIITLSPDGRVLAYPKGNVNVELHDARTGMQLATLRGHTGTIFCLSFSPDSKLLYTSSADGTLRTWNISPWCD